MLTGCSGVPLRSLPRLINLQEDLLKFDPGEFKFAVQTDAANTPPKGSLPTLDLYLRPAREGAFEPYQSKIPMQLDVVDIAPGLASAPPSRRWLIFSFGPQAQAELLAFQQRMKRRVAEKASTGGGSLSVGISQEGLAADDLRLSRTRWESWLQTDRKTGFFELWSGTIAELKALSRKRTE